MGREKEMNGNDLTPQKRQHRGTYIPVDALVHRSASDVFVNVPKLVASAIPGDKPPTRSGRESRGGSAAASVDRLYCSDQPTSLSSSPARQQTTR